MPGSNASSSDHERIKNVEEEIGLTGLRTEQLDEVVRELSGQVFELSKRLESLERKLTAISTQPEEVPNDPPPHSHRPA